MSYDKYIKYKSKYLQLKAKYTQVGGAGMWTIFYEEGQTKTTPITPEESDRLNEVIRKNKEKEVSIKIDDLRDKNDKKLVNYKDGIKNVMNYRYEIDANGKTGTRTSLSGTYTMILLPDDTQSASASGPPPASTAPPPRSAYVYAPPSTPPPSVIPRKLSNLLRINKVEKIGNEPKHSVLIVEHVNLPMMNTGDNRTILDIPFIKINDTQINMTFQGNIYPLSPTDNPTTWIYKFGREVEL
jgi:hypothetical protein